MTVSSQVDRAGSRSWSLVSAALVLCALTVPAATARAQEPVKIRVSWVAVPNNLPPFMFRKAGLAKHQGKSYSMEAVQYRATPQSIAALATGDLEIALLAYSSFPLAIQNANMQDLRIIADEFQDGAEGYYSAQFMVLKDGPVKTISDIKGKVVAVNARNGATHVAARSVLRKNGVQDRDYTVVEVAFANMRSVLAEKKADLISTATPQFSFDPDILALARPLFAQKDAFGKTDVVIWVARQSFLEKNRAAVVDLLEDMLRARRYLFDPANHDEAASIVSEFSKVPREKLKSWMFTKKDYYRDPDARPDAAALQANIDQLHQEGALKQTVEVKKYLDLSLLEEAIKRPR